VDDVPSSYFVGAAAAVAAAAAAAAAAVDAEVGAKEETAFCYQ